MAGILFIVANDSDSDDEQAVLANSKNSVKRLPLAEVWNEAVAVKAGEVVRADGQDMDMSMTHRITPKWWRNF